MRRSWSSAPAGGPGLGRIRLPMLPPNPSVVRPNPCATEVSGPSPPSELGAPCSDPLADFVRIIDGMGPQRVTLRRSSSSPVVDCHRPMSSLALRGRRRLCAGVHRPVRRGGLGLARRRRVLVGRRVLDGSALRAAGAAAAGGPTGPAGGAGAGRRRAGRQGLLGRCLHAAQEPEQPRSSIDTHRHRLPRSSIGSEAYRTCSPSHVVWGRHVDARRGVCAGRRSSTTSRC